MENALERECDYVEDSGYVQILQLFEQLTANNSTTNANAPYIQVIKHSELISRPEHVLRSICELFEIEFFAMFKFNTNDAFSFTL